MVLTPLTSFDDIREEWERFLSISPSNSLFLTPQWQQVWWDTFGDGKELAGYYLRAPEGVTAIAPLTRCGDHLAFLGNTDTFDYNDFMVRPGYEEVFFQSLLARLEEQGFRTLRLRSLTETSPTLAYLPELARRRGYFVEVEEEDVSSGVDLTQTWDGYLASLRRKDRHELRRKFRRLDSVANWRWYILTEPDRVSARVEDFISLMRQSNRDKDRYMTPVRELFFRRITQRMAQLGLLRLCFLEMDDQPVASSLCFDYATSRLLYNSGYDPAYSYYSVGLLLNALCLREAIEQGMQYFDFLRGPEPYKGHLGGKTSMIYQLVVTRS